MNFTKQELNLVNRILTTGKWERWMWELIYLVPCVALIVMGVIEESKRSICVGTGVLVIVHIITTIQQNKALPILVGICGKINDYNTQLLKCKPYSDPNNTASKSTPRD